MYNEQLVALAVSGVLAVCTAGLLGVGAVLVVGGNSVWGFAGIAGATVGFVALLSVEADRQKDRQTA
jgi:hypothetical protein